jgi:hypothetical protein
MTPISETPARAGGAATGAQPSISLAVEALRVAAIKSSHAADDIGIGDDIAAERSISIAISHLREGASAFRETQRALQCGAAEAVAP